MGSIARLRGRDGNLYGTAARGGTKAKRYFFGSGSVVKNSGRGALIVLFGGPFLVIAGYGLLPTFGSVRVGQMDGLSGGCGVEKTSQHSESQRSL